MTDPGDHPRAGQCVGAPQASTARPLTLDEACDRVRSWFEQPCVRVLHPTEHHWRFFQQMLRTGSATGTLVTDAHLAAVALEHNCELCSTDSDFARFPGLKWRNPLSRS